MELTDCASNIAVRTLCTLQFIDTHFHVAQLWVIHITISNIAAFSGLAPVEKGSKSFIFGVDSNRQVFRSEYPFYSMV